MLTGRQLKTWYSLEGIMKATARLGILMWLASLLALHASAQRQPALEDTMTLIANTLNSRGSVSWTTSAPDMGGAKWTTADSLAQINADPSSCSVAWTNVETVSSDKTMTTYIVQLQTVSVVTVQSYSLNMASQSSQWKLKFSPETYPDQNKN